MSGAAQALQAAPVGPPTYGHALVKQKKPNMWV